LKLKDAAFQMLLAASEAVGPQLVAALLYKRAAAHKNPKVSACCSPAAAVTVLRYCRFH
jgi:hypothetical protein